MKKKLIIIITIVILIAIGYIGMQKNEEDRMIENSVKAIESGDYEYALTALETVVDGNSKKVDKLWNIITCYQNASQQLYIYNNVDEAKRNLDMINNDYKKYNKLKNDVEELKEKLKVVENQEEGIDEIKKLMKKGDYYTALEMLKNMNDYGITTNEQNKAIMSLRNECNEQLAEKDTKINAWNIKEKDFDVEKAKTYALSNMDNEMLEIEIDEKVKYNEDNFKYFDIIYKYKETDEILKKVRIYSNGQEEMYMNY